MSSKKRKYYYLYLLVGMIIIVLISVQLYWINKTIAVEKSGINRSLYNDFEQLAEDIQKNSYCYVLHSRSYINKGEGIYLIKQKIDSNGAFIKPADGGKVDTITLFNYYAYNGDTVFENYSSLGLKRFSASLDVDFNFAYEGIMNPANYRFGKLTNENLSQAFDNTLNLDMILDKQALDHEIKSLLVKNNLDTNYLAGIRKANSPSLLFVSDSSRRMTDFNNKIEVPFFENSVSEPYLLVIGFPEPFVNIIRSLSVMMISSVIIIVILIASFLYFVRTIIKQRRLSEMKNAFINNITHEFRTPITNINLAIQNWRDTGNSADFYYNIIDEENKHLEKNVDQILQLATLKHNGLNGTSTAVDMHAVILKSIDSFRMQLNNVLGGVSLNLNADISLIHANEKEMLNMMQNLLDNAIKYSGQQPAIKINTYDTKHELVLEVEDNGIGMSAHTQSQIFERFYRSHTGDRHDVKGFGLGLSYVKYIVDNHKGQIQVKSKQGKGSRFIIYLPKK